MTTKKTRAKPAARKPATAKPKTTTKTTAVRRRPPSKPKPATTTIAAEAASGEEDVDTLVSSQPCPNCGNNSTNITTATRAAIPATTITGDEVKGGATIHACPHCGAILETFKTTIAKAWDTVEQRYADDVAAAQALTNTDTTEGS